MPGKLSAERLNTVTSSFRRCLLNDQFFTTFYERFLASSPEVRAKFAHTDMKRQANVLRQSLSHLLMFAAGEEVAEAALRRVAQVHDRQHHAVEPRLYELWVDTLMKVIRETDLEWTSELENEWVTVLRLGIDYMVERY